MPKPGAEPEAGELTAWGCCGVQMGKKRTEVLRQLGGYRLQLLGSNPDRLMEQGKTEQTEWAVVGPFA